MTIQTTTPPIDRGAEVPIEVDPLADIITGTGTRSDPRQAPGRLRPPLWRLYVTSEFGHRLHPVLGTTRFHRGIDYGARTGTPVRAAADGTVLWASELGPYGTLVVLAHDGDVHTAYGHLASTDVSVGQHIRSGQRIARVGATGLATGPHLHFEVRDDGMPVNPAPWLTDCLPLPVRAFDALASKLSISAVPMVSR